jgi:hypothetical protein
MTKATFSETQAEVPPLPEEALKASSPEIPLPMLFLRLPKRWGIGGWSDFTHCSWAQRSLKLIEEKDVGQKYTEIYKIAEIGEIGSTTCCLDAGGEFIKPDENQHPVISGDYYEDQSTRPDFYSTWLGADVDSYYRDQFRRQYNHYGGENRGVPYRWYYELWPPFFSVPDRPCEGDSFYSARDWGYGSNRNGEGQCSLPVENINRMTFTEAIKQYNMFTFQGKKNAYLMLGHAVHLLHDQGEPDHAKLVPHPGSGYTEERAYNDMYVCEVLAGEAALDTCLRCYPLTGWICFTPYLAFDPCAQTAFAIAEGACRASIDPNEVGYEWLVDNRWNLSRVDSRINSEGVINMPDYNSYFRDLAQFAEQKVGDHGLSSDYDNENSLGCGQLPLLPPIPGADPDIDMDDTQKVNRYLALTDDVATRAISLGAGLIQHFYQIVNPPPYVERVTITQDSNVRFDVSWEDETKGGTVASRVKRVNKNYTLYHGVPATITVRFGPRTADGRNRKMQPGSFSIGGQGGKLLGDREDDDWVLRANFPIACVQNLNPLSRTVRIDATDDAPHLSGRSPFGNALDKNPLTVASASFSQPYSWVNYELEGPVGFDIGTSLNMGIPPAYFRFDEILGTDSETSGRWTIRADARIRASMSILEQESRDLIKVGTRWEQCGRYSLYLPPTIEHLGTGPSITPRNGGFIIDPGQLFDTPVSGTPAQFGLTISLENPSSVQPVLTIQVASDAPSGLYLLPIILNYEFRDGRSEELYRFLLELQVRNRTEANNSDRAVEQAEDMMAGKEMARLKKLGYLDLRQGPAKVFDPCKAGAASPDFCFLKDPLKLSQLKFIADKEAVFISQKGEMVKKNFSAIGLDIRQGEKDTRILSFKLLPNAAPGAYFVPISVMVGSQKLDEFLAILMVSR